MRIHNWANDHLGRPHNVKSDNGIRSYESQFGAMMIRGKIQANDPAADRLSEHAWPQLQWVIEQFRRPTFLDVGCYSGWVYPQVKDLFDYHGIDIWDSAIDAAKLLWDAPERFERIDVRDYNTQHDIVFVSAICPETREDDVFDKLKSLAKQCLLISGTPPAAEGWEQLYDMPRTTYIWRINAN